MPLCTENTSGVWDKDSNYVTVDFRGLMLQTVESTSGSGTRDSNYVTVDFRGLMLQTVQSTSGSGTRTQAMLQWTSGV